jgi:hypothetical protein
MADMTKTTTTRPVVSNVEFSLIKGDQIEMIAPTTQKPMK